jgi:ribonuclease BN (tRNA processing enzyme)
LRSLPSRISLHDVPKEDLEVGNFRVTAAFVCHPGATVGFRIESPDGVIAYMPDHEPALGMKEFPGDPEWTSGFSIAKGADLLIHDAQYTDREYRTHVGWGHSSISQVLAFAELAGARHVVLFHHDPVREDTELEQILAKALAKRDGSAVTVSVAAEERRYRLEKGKLTVAPIPTPV